MIYNLVEFDGKIAYATLKHKRTGKIKQKEYSIYDIWVYRHGPDCNIIKVIAENTLREEDKQIQKQFSKEVKEFLEAKYKRWEVVYIYVATKYNITPCKDLSVQKCLSVMTPEQFFNEFGSFPVIMGEG